LKPGEAWLIFRLDSFIQIKGQPADIYLLMDVASAYVLGQIIVTGELPDLIDIHRLMKTAYDTKKSWPDIFFFPDGDPAENLFRKYAADKKITFEVQPLSTFNEIIAPIKQSFMEFQTSSENSARSDPQETQEIIQAFIPDSYDLCPCASGLKYKFCCKRIFQEIINAMTAAEDGHRHEALKWMKKAESKIGETAEILCRYAIVYSFYDKEKCAEYLEKCITSFPNHPRANYIRGIELKQKGDFEGAIEAYTKAIGHYPPTDRYHLNEVWNNLGSAYFELKKYFEAKEAWEKALEYSPRDQMAMNNLQYMIYDNPDVPEKLKS
jgi:tetratricopeptide (TPR) repeat protein